MAFNRAWISEQREWVVERRGLYWVQLIGSLLQDVAAAACIAPPMVELIGVAM